MAAALRLDTVRFVQPFPLLRDAAAAAAVGVATPSLPSTRLHSPTFTEPLYGATLGQSRALSSEAWQKVADPFIFAQLSSSTGQFVRTFRQRKLKFRTLDSS